MSKQEEEECGVSYMLTRLIGCPPLREAAREGRGGENEGGRAQGD